VDVASGGVAPHEGDGADGRVVADEVDGVVRPVDNVQDASGKAWSEGADSSVVANPSNLPRGFQRFGFVNPFRAGDFSDLG